MVNNDRRGKGSSMDTDAQRETIITKWLAEAFAATGKPKSGLADYLGILPGQVSLMLNGRKPIRAEDLPFIRDYFGIPLPDEFTHTGSAAYQFNEIPVVGNLALGVWIEYKRIQSAAESPRAEAAYVPRVRDPRFIHMEQKAMIMNDNSFDLEVPAGVPVVYVPYSQVREEFVPNDIVVVERIDNGKVETTLRQLLRHRSNREEWRLVCNTSDRSLLNADGTQPEVTIEQKNGNWIDSDNPKIIVNIVGFPISKQMPMNVARR
jgi:transcriptional regulator with XRE-family HTH domain